MSSERFLTSLSLPFLLIISGCAAVSESLKADPVELSPFLTESSQLPSIEGRYPFHHAWQLPKDLKAAKQGYKMSVAKVDLRYLNGDAWWYTTEDAAHSALKDSAAELGEYMRERFQVMLAEHGFEVVEEASGESVMILRLAIVELQPTDVYRKAAGTAASLFLPGGGAIGLGAGGTIAIEGVLEHAESGKEIFAFSDREGGKLAPFSVKDYTYFSHAREAIDDWAKQFAELCVTPNGVEIEDSSAVTLNPF